jgi:hypothetical protein
MQLQKRFAAEIAGAKQKRQHFCHPFLLIFLGKLMSRAGLEPATHWLKVKFLLSQHASLCITVYH